MRTLAGFVVSLIVALVAAPSSVSAAQPSAGDGQLYVAPWGRDSWPGTVERPFATPARAQRAVRTRTAQMDADIVVNLRGGTYSLTEPLLFSAAAGDAGAGGHSVIYQAYGYETARQEVPVVSGGRRVTGWRPAKDVHGTWRADVGDLETRQLFVDGRRAKRTALGRGLPGKAIMLPTGYATRSTVPQTWKRPADMELVFNGGKAGLPYSEARCGVKRIRGDAVWSVIDVDQPCFSDLQNAYAAEVPGATPAAPTDIENSLSLVRGRGSWYLDRSRPGRHVVYYRPRRGEDPRRVPVVAPVLEQLVVGTGTATAPLHDMAFRGLSFSYATWLAPSRPAGFPQIIGSWFYSAGKGSNRVPGHVSFRSVERLSVEGNHFTHLGGEALVLSKVGSGNTLRGNVIDDVSGGGLEVRGPGGGNRVEDNWIRDIGVDYRGSIAIALEGSPDATVAHNQINDVPYTGIWGESPRGLQVVDNLVFNSGSVVPDGGGIYLPFAQGTSFADGAVVQGNVVHDAGGVGVYPDVGADWVTVEHNVLFGQKNAVSGVEPRRIIVADNYWDDGTPFWWPKEAPTNGITLAGNTLLPRAHPSAACRTNADCADILATAGPRAEWPARTATTGQMAQALSAAPGWRAATARRSQ
jgi:Right handed beta helix region